MALKKIHARNLIAKKKILLLENSPPSPPPPAPHNFSNGPSLNSDFTVKVNNN